MADKKVFSGYRVAGRRGQRWWILVVERLEGKLVSTLTYHKSKSRRDKAATAAAR